MCEVKIYGAMCEVSVNFKVVAIVKTKEIEEKYKIKLESGSKFSKSLFLK